MLSKKKRPSNKIISRFSSFLQRKSTKKAMKSKSTLSGKSTKSTIKHNKTNLKNLYHTTYDTVYKTLLSFYGLQIPIHYRLITYNDPDSKRLYKIGFQNIKLSSPYSWIELDSTFHHIDNSYKIQRNIMADLHISEIPKSIKYATEDMTRGLAQFITNRYGKSLPHFKASNAFIKMWDILSTFDIIPTTSQNKFKVFHIAEAPGQMILATQYYARKKCRNITPDKYDWRANSLNPFNPAVRAKFGRVLGDDYGLIKGNPRRWLWGADNTGDITQPENIKWFRDYINNTWLGNNPDKPGNKTKLDLIVGDGGFGSGNDAIILQRIDLGQVIMVMACSSPGGSCVIKHFTPYMTNHPETIKATGFFVSFIYLYYLAFEEVSLFKPYSSDMTSGEFYVIGKGFRGIDDSILERLYKVIDNFEVNNAVIPRDMIPETFVLQINGFIDKMTEYNFQGYEKTNLLLTCLSHDRTGKHSGKGIGKNITINKILRCDDFLDQNKIENILVPRYNQWIKKYKFE
jgi:hypothetical protein